jgi:hypothetical protein
MKEVAKEDAIIEIVSAVKDPMEGIKMETKEVMILVIVLDAAAASWTKKIRTKNLMITHTPRATKLVHIII